MVNNNLKLGVGLTVLLVVVLSGLVVRYALKQDPTTVDHSEKSMSQNSSVDGDSSSQGGVLDTDEDLLTTLGGDNSEDIDIDEPVTTQSTEKVDNRRKTETQTTTTAKDSSGQTKEEKTAAAKEKAGKELDAAAAKLDDISAKLDKAKDELSDAKSKRDAKQTEYNDAKAKLDEAKRNYDEGQKENYEKGMVAFFESIGAGDAVDTMNGSDFNSAVEASNANDAASLECIKRSIDFLNRANQLRADEGKEELKVSCKLMAIAALNNDMSSSAGSSSNCSELDQNICYGFEDPFTTWYDNEREEQGGNYRSLVNEDHVAAGFAFSNKNGTVHNIVFANADYDAGSLMTVSDFADAFNSYYVTAIKGKSYTAVEENFKRIEKELNDAKQAVTNKENEVQSASTSYGSAKTVYDQKLKTYQQYQ